MVVTHNLAAFNAQRQYNIVDRQKTKTIEKLSSGFRINRAADDAAGLSISEKMCKQIRGLTQGVKNAQDGVSLCQVADGALAEVDDMLHRITELSVKSANGTNSESDRQEIQQEISHLVNEINRIGETTTFNQRSVFKETIVNNGHIMTRHEALSELKTGTFKNVDTDIIDKEGNILLTKDAANTLSAGATDRYHQGHTGDDRWNAAYAFASAGYCLGYNMGDAAAEYDITVLGNRDQGVSSGVYTGRIEDGMIRCTNDLITAMKYLTEEEHPDGIPDDMQTFLDGLNDLDSVADYYAYLNSSEDFQTLDRDSWIQSGAENS